jgi:arylsulfatase A-like enzyme/Tfp pilus assembly protein PilF
MNMRRISRGLAGVKRLASTAGLFVLILAASVCRESSKTGGGAASAPSSSRPDVLLVTIDTLRADALGFSGNRRVETPVLDRLAARGVVFANAHAHNVVTLPSHANILTGLLPYQHGIRDNTGFRLDPSTPTLATMLKEEGYATAAFVGAFPLDSRFGLDRGFDVYDDRYPRGRTRLDFEMPERPASEVVTAALAWWRQKRSVPRFLWVHLYDPHAPYRPPAPFAERYRSNEYLGEVAATDAALAPLLDPISSGAAPPAFVVVTADHGEALGDHGEKTHGLFAYEATLQVPLVVCFPGKATPRTSKEFARHIDIVPTVLEVLGVAKPAAMTGSSLLAASGVSRPTYFESFSTALNRGWAPLSGVIADGTKFIDLPVPELYDLAADPAETHNLASERPEVLSRLARSLPAESQLGRARRASPAPEEVARLRSLGYLSGSAAIKARYTAEDDPKNLVSIDQQLHESVDFYQRGKLADAIRVARSVLEERPGMEAGYENLGFLLRRADQIPEALRVYRSALDRGVASEELTAHFALALSEIGRSTEALSLLAPLSGSSDPETLNALGIALSDSGRPAEAVKAFERALELDPDFGEAVQNLGIVRLRTGDAAGARDLFERALAMDDKLPRAWNGLGVALARLGDDRSAIDAWHRAVALDPALYDALFNLGLTAGKQGMRREARAALERFVATAPPVSYRADIERARGLLKILEAAGS